MNIAMFTNTFTPHVGGVARSVQGLADELRRRGHAVLLVAPWFAGSTRDEPGVVRIPAVQHFNGTDFSLPVPFPGMVNGALEAFRPDLVHSHHPFLLGDSALRVAAKFEVPIVFTHHTRYEQYTHYLPGDSAALKHFVIDLVTGYCNLCNGVIAPSRSIADLLHGYAVKTTISIIPTGVDPLYFQPPDDAPSLKDLGIPEDAFVLGHVGRLAPEKNLMFLSECVIAYLIENSTAHFLLVGDGPVKSDMLALFQHHGLQDRVHPLGVLTRTALAGVYRCMDLFVFASCSETQGLVLAEAMAAGTPVIALDAPGVMDIVVDFVNGRLLQPGRPVDFISAISWFAGLSGDKSQQLRIKARQAAEQVSLATCTEAMLDLYDSLIGTRPVIGEVAESRRQHTRKRIRKELEILGNYSHAIEETIKWMPLQKKNSEPASTNRPQGENTHPSNLTTSGNIVARGLAAMYAPLFRAIRISWRRKTIGLDIIDKTLAQNRRVLAVFWHGTYPALFPLLEGYDACTLTSESFRGQIIAHLSKHFGFHGILIPDHHSRELYKKLGQELQLHHCLAVAVDGPLGPYHSIRESLVMLAARLDLAIIPLSIVTKPSVVMKRRWDKLQIPLPFSRIILGVGEPFALPDRFPVHEAKSWAKQLRHYMEQNDRITASHLTGD